MAPYGDVLFPTGVPTCGCLYHGDGGRAELGIISYWGQLAAEVPLQKQDGPFTDVIAYLDDLA